MASARVGSNYWAGWSKGPPPYTPALPPCQHFAGTAVTLQRKFGYFRSNVVLAWTPFELKGNEGFSLDDAVAFCMHVQFLDECISEYSVTAFEASAFAFWLM